MVTNGLSLYSKGLLWLGKTYELNGDDSALMEELEETVLSVGTGLSKVDDCCLILNLFSFRVYSLAIALHVQLLDVRGELAQGLAVGDNSSSWVFLNAGPVEP